ncbi:MAG TPA: YraN family protein [Bacillota bacterium]|jgi:putative endonuclease|nr:YraN family protein [Bacillota bacterium]
MRAQDVGRAGEVLAREYLVSLGYEILGCNLRLGRNEIDILARDGDVLVVVEVKTRRSTAFGRPEEQITLGKLRTLRLVATRVSAACRGAPVRVDVVAVMADAATGESLAGAAISHLRNVLT